MNAHHVSMLLGLASSEDGVHSLDASVGLAARVGLILLLGMMVGGALGPFFFPA